MNLQGGMEQTPKENCLTAMYVLACYHRPVACVFSRYSRFPYLYNTNENQTVTVCCARLLNI